MRRKWWKLAVVALLIIGGISGALWSERKESVMGSPSVSPDGRYEVRCYRVRTISSMFRPARGPDEGDGYVRLYDRKTGAMMEEAFCSSIHATLVFWNEDSVGFTGSDGVVWNFPEL